MSTPRKKRTAKEIFNAAVEYYEPRQWEGFIVDACGEDESLRQRVRELLDAHQQSDRILDGNAERSDDLVITERPGTQIGPYKLLQEIGEGGFGVVYMAEQLEPVRRKVALKIIKPGMDTKQVIARFEAERQALAMMDHPNIAKVLDAGATESGRPYFVMELVKGVSITEFCDSNKLPTRERLELFVLVCRAIQHAHQKGVIHRDLKPTNVMVTLHDNRPMPVIIDFGVSKAISHQLTEKTLFTAYGQMVGTPAYMSPEQAQMSRMDIDTRSDIYSLGVLLYELLTGSTPLDEERLRGTAYVEMQRLIREEEAPKPSTRLSTLGNALAKIAQQRGTEPNRLGQFLRGDLDWITMKALEKERNRRYETANGLANDITRFLNDEAVEACPPSIVYQMRKFVGRHRGLVTAGTAIAAAVLLGIVGTTIGMVQARRDAAFARTALQDADQAKNRANILAEEKQAEAQRYLEAKQEADRYRDVAKAQVAEQLATRAGIERTRGDITLAALLDAEALGHDRANPRREANHRRRLAADLRQCPRPTHLFFHDSTVLDARFSTDGKWIATACEDGAVLVRDVESGSIVRTASSMKHEGAVTQVTFVHGDKHLLAFETGAQRSAGDPPAHHHLWEWKTGRSLAVAPYFTSIKYVDDAQRETYPVKPAENRLELRSVADARALGSPLEHPHEIYRSYSSGRQCMLLITRESAGDPASSELAGTPIGRRAQQWNYRGELWNARTGKSNTLFDSPAPTGLGFAPSAAKSNWICCFSGDRTLVAAQVRDRFVNVYDVETGTRIQQFQDNATVQTGAVSRPGQGPAPIQFSPDNRLLMCLRDRAIVLLDIASGAMVGRRIPVSTTAANCKFSPDGTRVLSINRQGDPQLWYASTGEAASPPLEHEAVVQEVAFAPDGRYVKVVSVDGSVRVWDSLSGTPAAPLLKHIGSIAASSFSRDGSHLLVAAGGNVWVWPVGWPEFSQVTIPLPPAPARNRRPNATAQISPNGQLIVTVVAVENMKDSTEAGQPKGILQCEVRVWQSTTGQLAHGPLVLDTPSPLGLFLSTQTATFSRDGRRILLAERGGIRGNSRGESARNMGSCRVWDLESGKVVTFQPANDLQFIQARFTDDGRHAITAHGDPIVPPGLGTGSESKRNLQMQRWDCETSESVGPAINVTVTRSRASPRASFFPIDKWSPSGRQYAQLDETSSNRQVILLDTDTGEPMGPPLEHQGPVSQLKFYDAGRGLMTVVHFEDRMEVSLWDTATSQRQAGPLSFAMDGESRRLLSTVHPVTQCLAIYTSGSGTRSVSPSTLSPTVVVHHLDNGTRFSLQHEQGVTNARFDAEGRYLMTTCLDNVVRIWDPQRGQLVRTLHPHVDGPQLIRASFSEEGDRVITQAGASIRVWEVATGQPLSALLKGQSSRTRGGPVGGMWSAAADRFLLQDGQQIIVHDLSSEDRPVDQVQRMTQVLSGRRVNQLGNIETLSSSQLQQEWKASIDNLRDRLIRSPMHAAWHRLQVQKTDDSHAAMWHLNRLIPAEPNDGDLYLRRGRLLAKQDRHDEALADFDAALANDATNVHADRANTLAHLGRWEEAAIDLDLAIQQLPRQPPGRRGFGTGLFASRPALMEALGLAQLLSKNHDGYEEASRHLLSLTGSPASNFFVRTLLLVPRGKEYVDDLAERLEGVNTARINAFLGSRIGGQPGLSTLIAFRRGDFDTVIQLLGNDSDPTAAADILLMAMARKQLGDSDQATRLFNLATERMRGGNTEVSPLESRLRLINTAGSQTWVNSAIVKILHREADQMLNGKPTTPDPPATNEN